MNTLHSKVTAIGHSEASFGKLELILSSFLIVYYRSNVDDDVLCAKILQNWELLRILFVLATREVYQRINDLNQLVLPISHDESAHASDLEIKVVDEVTLLIEVSRG